MNQITLSFEIPQIEAFYQKNYQSETLQLATTYFCIKLLVNSLEYFVHSYLFGFSGQLVMVWFATEQLAWIIISRWKPERVQYILSFHQMLVKHAILEEPLTYESISEVFHQGAQLAISTVTLLLLTSEFIFSTLTFIFTLFVYAYTYRPPYFDYNYANFLQGCLWVIYLKYLLEKEKRKKFLLQNKDYQWSQIIENMFNWIAVVKMDKKINQISLVNINNHFRSDCNIENDQDFRKFSRTLRLKPKQKHEIFQNFVFKLSKNASASRRFDFLRSKDLEKLPTLENKIREILDGPVETVGRTTRTNSFSGQTKEKSSSPNGRSQNDFAGIQHQPSICQEKDYYKIQLLPGYDSEPFVVLLIDKEKHMNRIIKLEEKFEIIERFISKKYLRLLYQLNSSFCMQKKLRQLYYQKKHNEDIPKQITANQGSLLISIIHKHNFLLYLNQVENFQIRLNRNLFFSMKLFNILYLLQHLQHLFSRQIKIEIINKLQENDMILNQSLLKVLQILINFLENVWKHSQHKQELVIQLTKCQFDQTIQITFQQTKFKNKAYKYLLKSYEVAKFSEKKVKILDVYAFSNFIRQKQRIGWLVNRLLLSDIGPTSDFMVSEGGKFITFQIYQHLDRIC